MDEPAVPPSPSATVDANAVQVSVRVHCDLGRAWVALRERHFLAKWFADLEQSWVAGTRNRIDFGDGDFFDVFVHRILDRALIDFEWRFLGLGPVARVHWRLREVMGGTDVIVEDYQPDRSAAEVAEMIAGWSDFLERLWHYIATGQTSRYGYRDQIDGAVDLASPAGWLLDGEAIYRWLPISSDGFRPCWFFVVDEEGPRRFRLDSWQTAPGQVEFTVEIPETAEPTCSSLVLPSAGEGATGGPAATSRLSFAHTGWTRLGLPERRARQLRQRFTATWVAALKQAQTLAEQG